MYAYVYVYDCVWVCTQGGQKRTLDSPGTGVIGYCELLSMDPAQILCKTCTLLTAEPSLPASLNPGLTSQ